MAATKPVALAASSTPCAAGLFIAFITAAFGNLSNGEDFDELLFCCRHNRDHKTELE